MSDRLGTGLRVTGGVLLGAVLGAIVGLGLVRPTVADMRSAARELVPSGFTVTDVFHQEPELLFGRPEAIKLRASSGPAYRPGGSGIGAAAAAAGWDRADSTEGPSGDRLTLTRGGLEALVNVQGSGREIDSPADLDVNVYRRRRAVDVLPLLLGAGAGGGVVTVLLRRRQRVAG